MTEQKGLWSLRLGLIVTDSETVPNSGVLAVPARLGIEPMRQWSRGDSISRVGTRVQRVSGFRYDFFRGEDGDPEMEVRSALSWLEAAGAREILSGFESELAITVKLFARETPALGLSVADVKLAAELAVAIDFDLYVWSQQ